MNPDKNTQSMHSYCMMLATLLVIATFINELSACDTSHFQGYTPRIIGKPGYQDQGGAESAWMNNAFDPINPESGEFVHSETDLYIKARGLDVVFKRTYRSRSISNLALGPGWEFNWHQRIMELDDHTVILQDGSSRRHRFVPESIAFKDDMEDDVNISVNWPTYSPEWSIAEDEFNSPGRSWKNDGTESGSALVSATFALTNSTDPWLRFYSYFPYNYDNGYGTVDVWEPDAGWVEVYRIDTSNFQQTWNQIEVNLNQYMGESDVALRFTMIVTPNSSYEQDPLWWIDDIRVDEGLLSTGIVDYQSPNGIYDKLVKDVDGSFTLTSKDKIIRTFDVDGKIVEVSDRNGNTLTFNYYQDLSGLDLLFEIEGPSDYFKDEVEGTIALDYRLKEVVDATGRIVTLTYDGKGRIDKITDFTQREWIYGYDSTTGDLTSVTNPMSPLQVNNIKYYEYDNHQMTNLIDYKGQYYLTNTYGEEVSGSKNYVSEQYFGTSTSPSTVEEYEFSFNRVSKVSASNQRGYGAEITFDALGRMASEKIISDGYPQGEEDFQTFYEHNSNGEVTRVKYPRGNSVEYAYDDDGNLTEIRRKDKDSTSSGQQSTTDIVTIFTYEQDPLKDNFLKTIQDPLGNITTFYYDYDLGVGTAGNLMRIEYPAPDAVSPNPEVNYEYTVNGQIWKITDPNLNVTEYTYYSTTGYLKSIILGSGSANSETINFIADDVGNYTHVTDQLGYRTIYTYDELDRVKQITFTSTVPDSPSYETYIERDANGNAIQIDRQMVTETPGDRPTLGSVNPTDDWQSVVYTYNDMDQLETITNDSGDVITYSYDGTGNLETFDDPMPNAETTFLYDERNLLWKVTDNGSNVTEYLYDANGNLESVIDAKNQRTDYVYDYFDRLITKTYPDLSSETIDEYDKASNIILYSNESGDQIRLGYDNLHRLRSKKSENFTPAFEFAYTYDLGGRLDKVSDSTGDVVNNVVYDYDYNEVDRIRDVIITPVAGGQSYTISYEYDSAGNLYKLIYPDSDYIEYEYDVLNRLERIKDSGGTSIAEYLNYDALDRYWLLSYANGTVTDFTYDNLNRMGSQTVKDPLLNTLFQIDYEIYDAVGNLTDKTDAFGDHDYTYDSMYQLDDVDYPAGYIYPDTNYVYDAVGNRTSVTEGGGTPVTYVPNSLNQYFTVGGTEYTYLNGNLIDDGQFTYTYDRENQLTSIQGSVTIQYEYDGLGNRIKQDVNGTVTRFLYDGDHVIAEINASGGIQTKYVYGPGMDNPVRIQRGSQKAYYHTDNIGSVIALTLQSGSLLEFYCYDAYGKVCMFDGTGQPLNPQKSLAENRFFFTGREYDTDSELYYYRTRYYHPGIGRFMSRDTWPGWKYEPMQMVNSYGYVTNNPTNYIDPYGLFLGWDSSYDFWGDARDLCVGAGDNVATLFGILPACGIDFVFTEECRKMVPGSNEMVNKCSGWHTTGDLIGDGIGLGLAGGIVSKIAGKVLKWGKGITGKILRKDLHHSTGGAAYDPLIGRTGKHLRDIFIDPKQLKGAKDLYKKVYHESAHRWIFNKTLGSRIKVPRAVDEAVSGVYGWIKGNLRYYFGVK